MDIVHLILNIILHLDTVLGQLITEYGAGTIYAIIFAAIFSETGLVVVAIMPGDSLLFVVGALSKQGHLNLILSMIVMSTAAILGDTVNYHIGKYIGPKVFTKTDSRLLNKRRLIEANEFYEKHGGKTIILARFIPFLRAFAPFVAGIGLMSYKRFLSYNVIGAIGWVIVITTVGYFLGNVPEVRDHFSAVVIGIICLTTIPTILHEYMDHRKRKALREEEEF